jgi:hypothetical protein
MQGAGGSIERIDVEETATGSASPHAINRAQQFLQLAVT